VDEEPELRPLPSPPRCRGIPLGDGNYTGCAYGYGDLAPFTWPRDCPVCNGSGFEGHIETTLPHSDFGDLPGFNPRPAVMVSRRQNHAHCLGRETPLIKTQAVIAWMLKL
jgi:hypothetical protein